MKDEYTCMVTGINFLSYSLIDQYYIVVDNHVDLLDLDFGIIVVKRIIQFSKSEEKQNIDFRNF